MPDNGDLPDDEADQPVERPSLTREDLSRPKGAFPFSGETVGLVLVAVLGVLMVGFILGRVTAPDESATTTTSTTTPATLAFPAGDVDRSGYWAFAAITPVVTDSFDRDSPRELGQADTGGTWQEPAGSWNVRDDQAAAEADGSDQPGLASIGGGSADRLTEATLAVFEPGAGILFRYQNAENYWAVTADEGGSSWSVFKVLGGQAALMGTVPAPASDGTTMAVSQRAAQLLFLVDGVIKLQIDDPALAGETRSGLVAPPDGSGQARWDRFFVGDLPPGS